MTAPSRDLVFSQQRLLGSPTPLVFGEDIAVATPAVTADIYVTLSGTVSVSASVVQPTKVEIAVLLDGTVSVSALAAVPVRVEAVVLLAGHVTVTAAAVYDNRVTPWLDQRAAAPHQTAVADFMARSSEWGVSAQKRDSAQQTWQVGQRKDAVAGVPFDASQPLRSPATLRHQTAAQAHRQVAADHQKALQPDTLRASRYTPADHRAAQSASPMQAGVFQAMHHADLWQWAASKVRNLSAPIGASGKRSGVQFASMPWQLAGQARNGKSAWPPVQPEGPTVYPRDGHLLFECPPLTGFPVHLVFGPRACYLPAGPTATVVVPLLRTYVTINSISLRRVDGDLAIPTYAFQMSLDVDSWTWSWSASVPADVLPLVQPGSNGEPVEVEVLVNDVPYRLYAESIVSQRQFGQARIAVKGRGKAAMLDAPYAPVRNHGNAAPRTAQQLMLDVLTINGVGIGWAVDWGLTDWLVPGNTWTHQGAYIGAVLNIAQAAGGYVQPHDTAQTLRILPRYPAAPWDWAAITPDFELPAAVVAVEGIDWARKADYNRVFVSGMSNGVLGQITRAGTAGESVAPMVTDALITHADAARQRGVAILSDTGNQARVTLTLPVLAQTGLIKPGQFVRYLDGRQTRLGLVRSNSLAWSRPKLRQTISVETHA